MILIVSLAVLAGCGLAGAMLARNTLHVERRHGPETDRAVSIAARDGVQLRASWAAPPAGFLRCVLVMHGVGDSRGSAMGFAPLFLGEGYGVLAPDSRAHGDSGGELITFGILERHDTLAWVRWMRSQGCHKIYGLGESLGGAVLIQAAAEESAFDAIVAEGAFADIQDAAEDRLQKMVPVRLLGGPLAWMVAVNGRWYTRLVYGFDLAEASPLQAMPHVHSPVLLIHGTADDQTPPEHSKRLTAANPRMTSLWLVDGAYHTGAYARAPREFERRVLTWFAAH
jgi:fermentation-respiration switch protein FrsA (DUF1100 family)